MLTFLIEPATTDQTAATVTTYQYPTTANNWKGGIGTLHLTIDKLKPNHIISFCWNGGLKKTGPTRFESTLTNVAPSQDIKFVVLE